MALGLHDKLPYSSFGVWWTNGRNGECVVNECKSQSPELTAETKPAKFMQLYAGISGDLHKGQANEDKSIPDLATLEGALKEPRVSIPFVQIFVFSPSIQCKHLFELLPYSYHM